MSTHFPPQLLEDYLSRAPRRAVLATSLRTHSLAARHLLLHAAVGPHRPLDNLIQSARGELTQLGPGDLSKADLDGLARLARALALQRILPDDEVNALALCELILAQFGPKRLPASQQTLHAQLAYSLRRENRLSELLPQYLKIRTAVREALQLDLTNPFLRQSARSSARWLRRFEHFLNCWLRLTDEAGPPLDRLDSVTPQRIRGDERVSVIVTAFEPTMGLLAAVRSLTRQSWLNTEILVVNDGSQKRYDPFFLRCRQLDDRVRVITLPENVGTYRARNVALDQATGDLITFLDSDDWAHPKRVEDQLRPILADDSLIGTTARALKVTDALQITEIGLSPFTGGPASLMFRKGATLGRIGYLHGIRKSADNEFLRRIMAAFGDNSVFNIRRPLLLYRQRPGSLSRAEFRGSFWMHPARFAYRSAYTLWHDEIRAGRASPYLAKDPASAPMPAPSHFVRPKGAGSQGSAYDVLFVGDWRDPHGPQRQMIEEIEFLSRRGARLAVMHIESFRTMTVDRRLLSQPIQRLINREAVSHYLPTDPANAELVIVGDPSILQFPPHESPRLEAKSVAIVASEAPAAADGADLRYVPQACTAAAVELFRARAVWIPKDRRVREGLERSGLPQAEVGPFDLPGLIDPQQWRLDRRAFRSTRPVMGRHSRDTPIAWPRDREVLLRVYPDAPGTDIRVLGGARALDGVLDGGGIPPNWLVYEDDEVEVKSFLNQLDFWVYYSHPEEPEALKREIVEALASGCVVILPPRFSDTFGDAALYRRPAEVQQTISFYYERLPLFLDQSRRGERRVAERFSPGNYLWRISKLLGASEADGSPHLWRFLGERSSSGG